MDEETEVIDSPTDTEVESETTGTEVAESAVDVAKLQETNRKLFERAKKAEAALKAAEKPRQAPAKQQEVQTQQPSSNDVEEVVLKAQGMDNELLKQLKEVSQFKGISLIDAQKDPLFVAVKNEFESVQRSRAAAMPAARGSGSPAVKPTLATPKLSEAEHKALWKERIGR